MTTHILAALIGPFELIALFVFLAAPVVLTIAYIIVMSRVKKSRGDICMTEANMLRELAEMEAAVGISDQDKSTSLIADKAERIYVLNSL